MKIIQIFTFLLLVCLFQSCTKDTCTNKQTYNVYDPVYVLPDSVDKNITIESARPLKNPGKIYFYKDYIFINEPYEGFHIINNKIPSAPVNERFVKLQGNVDLAVMNDYLYADAYIDLVIIDLRNMDNIKQTDRKAGVFNSHYHYQGSGAILSHYKKTERTETVDCSNEYYGRGFFFKNNSLIANVKFSSGFDASGRGGVIPGGAVGQGGSLARFTLSKGHLYAIGNSELYSFTINESGQVNDPKITNLPWGIETIFPYKEYLFVGANNGMHLLSIENPSEPTVTGTFQHARACDPVVAQDDIAYVTLRDGTECQGFLNQLEIIDVKDVKNPKLLYTVPMDNPHGLAVDGDYLYLCEGTHGLKVFNTKDLANLKDNQVGSYKDFHAWDVISLSGHSLLVIGNDGFRQYDHSNPEKLVLISTIPVQK